MKSNLKKTVAMLLALVMLVGTFAGCGKKTDAPVADKPAVTETNQPEESEQPTVTGEYVDPYTDIEDYDEKSAAIYKDVLGGFMDAYQVALDEKENVSRRFALMAQAEAKLMETAVMMPMTTRGGNYAINRLAPRSVSSVMWGGDAERRYSQIATTEFINVEDQNALKALWAEAKDGAEYQAAAKAYLEEHGYELTRELNESNPFEIKNWDVLATARTSDYRTLIQTYDNLVEYDCKNVMQPSLAESWEVSEDGLTYTFKIRQGVKWYDAQGREIADLTADDFVAGMQHMLDAQGGLEFLVDNKIVNAHEYIVGDVTDFAEVGVKALDDYTLQYTLVEPVSFFMTMLPYSCFAPMSRTFYEAQGGKFGAEYDASAATYKYGKGPDSIAYCGAFLISNYTPENIIAYKANPNWWNAENNNFDTFSRLYNDGKDPIKTYTDTVSGTICGTGLNPSAVEAAKKDGIFDANAVITSSDGTSYMGFYNVNRMLYENFNDGAAKSSKDDAAKERSIAALRNEHFRRAVSFATDRAARNAQVVGEELKLNALRNSYTPGTFVKLEEEVTIDLNGTETTFPAGTYYGEIMQAQIDADGVQMKVWDPAADGGIGSSDGFDGWYNPEAAKAELEEAVKELAAIGVEVSAENPIYIDMPYEAAVEAAKNRANAHKQSVETALEGKVIINLVACASTDEYNYTGYLANTGDQDNYDFTDGFGWGPDYGDPSTYLDTFLPEYAGYMVKSIGIF